MDNLVAELEEMKICGEIKDDSAIPQLWQKCIEIVVKAYVPPRWKAVETTEPCVEKDFREYRITINENLLNIAKILEILNKNINKSTIKSRQETIELFCIHILLLIGEHSEKNLWNNAESVIIGNDIEKILCDLFEYENSSEMLRHENRFNRALLLLREKLLKDTWKAYPAAVVSYKWLLNEIKDSIFVINNIGNILPTALIILDDYIPVNRFFALQCINCILRHSYMKVQLMENGYDNVIYGALERLSHERNAMYVIPLYTAFEILLATMELLSNHSLDAFQQWTKRDDVIATLLDNMECESNLELRHAYMTSLPQLLSNVACAKWCERLTRILAEYCGNHTDLRTLKATLQASEALLSMFQLRIPAHSTSLYTAFLKLHIDLTEQTPIFDKEITQSLESCINLLYKLTPNIGTAIMRDDRMRFVIKNSLDLGCLGDTRYCN